MSLDLNKKKMIEEADARFQGELYHTADMICGDPELKLVRLSGPTCAGKTTAAKMIVKRMSENSKNAVFVSIDDFYYDCDHLEKISRDNGLDVIDYDSPATIDTEAMAAFLDELFEVGEAVCPHFNFTTGKREVGKRVVIGENDIIVLEGIQAVYPQVLELLGKRRSECIFIEPRDAIVCKDARFEPNEIRLMRRIVRDSNFRSTSAVETMELWKGVRANEEKNIFPYVDRCKYRINSTMPYEIGVLRPYLERALVAGESDALYEKYKDEFAAMLEKVSVAEPVPASYIDEDSLYKEFV